MFNALLGFGAVTTVMVLLFGLLMCACNKRV